MSVRLLIALVTVNAVVSQLLLRRASREVAIPSSLHHVRQFILDAMMSPWIYASIALQIVGYIFWLLLVSNEKLGVATAGVGGGFYLLMSISAWLLYGESLSNLQWIGIVLVTVGVACVGLKQI